MDQAPRQQNKREEPSLTQGSLVRPALSVEAQDPAITSTWVRLFPLPGSAPSTILGPICQGRSWGSRPFEGAPWWTRLTRGAPTTLWPETPTSIHPPPPPRKRAIGPPVLPGSSLQTGCPRACPPSSCAPLSRPTSSAGIGASTCQVSSKPLLSPRAKAPSLPRPGPLAPLLLP